MGVYGAFYGAPVNATIPAGYGVLDLFWTTSDGQNQQVTFNITGTQTTSVQSDSNGHASVMLPVGNYSVTPIHSGSYDGDGVKIAVLTSKETTILSWFAAIKLPQVVLFSSNATIPSASYTISKDGQTVLSGTGWSPGLTVELEPGDYTLSITAHGSTASHEFSVASNDLTEVDISSLFCKITVSCNLPLKSLTFNGTNVRSLTSGFTAYTFDTVRTSSSRGVSGTPVSSPSYSGKSSATIWTASVPTVSVTPNTTTCDVTLTQIRTGRVLVITSNGTLNVPKGVYKLLVMGGGGGGDSEVSSSRGGGGGGGNADLKDRLLEGSYSITIGNGGEEHTSGEASSFGDITASGGSAGGIMGGRGGSGGGGGYYSNNMYYYSGGGGSIFGGGGGAATYNRSGQGGAGGRYGGSGGSGGTEYSGGAENGDAGVDDGVFGSTSSASGGSGGGSTRGGGGGGGFNAAGGNGNAGGGGGGGIAGGNGGKGGSHGKGYGSGGAGYRGGGGGGYGSSSFSGSSGAKGCVVIQWIEEAD